MGNGMNIGWIYGGNVAIEERETINNRRAIR
jgi:hypothetical protein